MNNPLELPNKTSISEEILTILNEYHKIRECTAVETLAIAHTCYIIHKGAIGHDNIFDFLLLQASQRSSMI